MKKAIASFLFIIAIVASVNAQARDFSLGRVSSFEKAYQEAIVLNESRFVDVNRIQVGDTVLFPSRGAGVEAWIADAPANGVHDCIWRLTAKYLAGQLITIPVDTICVPVKTTTAEVREVNLDNLADFLLVALVVLLILFILYKYFKNKQINDHPMVAGGLSDDPSVAMAQLNQAYPGKKAIKVTRGIVVGAGSVKVLMAFSDKSRLTPIKSGESAYEVIYEDGSVAYYKKHCGNLFGEIADGKFNLPKGWRFMADNDEAAVWEEKVETKEVVNEKVETEEDEEFPFAVVIIEEPAALDATGVALILKTAGEMKNKPYTVTYRDLTIEFPGASEK
jgi:hypothetical protein